MNRHFASAMLVAIGIMLGYSIGSHSRNDSGLPAARANDAIVAADGEAIAQLKEINTQLKAINTLLHTGAVKTVVLINPDAR